MLDIMMEAGLRKDGALRLDATDSRRELLRILERAFEEGLARGCCSWTETVDSRGELSWVVGGGIGLAKVGDTGANVVASGGDGSSVAGGVAGGGGAGKGGVEVNAADWGRELL